MMSSKSDIDHWYINATVYKDRVEEIHYITDAARNIRRRPQTRVWQVQQSLGRGGFGEVRLERSKEDGKARAVKRIATTNTALSNSECEKELKALLEFSKPKVSQIRMRIYLRYIANS
jgi:serine/threonine protein kinase